MAMQANPEQTLLLTRQVISDLAIMQDYLTAVESAFEAYAAGTVEVPEVVHIHGDQGAFHVKSAGLTSGSRYVAVKVNGNFPDNRQRTGLPTIQGAILLCDGHNGFPLAIMDSTEITAQRTAAASAVAAKYLARPEAEVACIIGCGIQGRMHIEALLKVLPLKSIFAFDVDPDLCQAFAEEMTKQTGVTVIALEDFAKGTRASQVIVTCTSSRVAFLNPEHVQAGTFIAAVGADNDDKQELDIQLVADSVLVTDITEQCAQIGELHHALDAGVVTTSHVYAELGEVVTGKKRVVEDVNNIILFDSTGSAIQDVAAAGVIYERARDQGLGISIALT